MSHLAMNSGPIMRAALIVAASAALAMGLEEPQSVAYATAQCASNWRQARLDSHGRLLRHAVFDVRNFYIFPAILHNHLLYCPFSEKRHQTIRKTCQLNTSTFVHCHNQVCL